MEADGKRAAGEILLAYSLRSQTARSGKGILGTHDGHHRAGDGIGLTVTSVHPTRFPPPHERAAEFEHAPPRFHRARSAAFRPTVRVIPAAMHKFIARLRA